MKHVWTLVAVLTSVTWPRVEASAGSRRFVVDDLGSLGNFQHISCQVCYDCLCKGHWDKCLNKFMSHDKIRRWCPAVAQDLNKNCTAPYAQDGGWTHWSPWGACKGPCDNGSRTRTRSCSNPQPYNCGAMCHGDDKQEHLCTPRHCTTTTKPTAVPSTTPTTPTTTTTRAVSTSTTKPTAVPSTTPTPPTTTTTRAVSTASQCMYSETCKEYYNANATAQAKAQTCSKFCAGAAVALNHTLVQTAARTCPDGKHGGSDALLIQCCHLQAASAWTRGANVILGCQSLPSYTPIAKFNSQTYTFDTAGVFVECLTNGEVGFTFIHQTCDKKPEIIHVSTTNVGFDAIKYYTILQ